MSLSLLYHALGLYGFHQLRSWQKGGALYLEVVRSKKRCRPRSASWIEPRAKMPSLRGK